MKLKTLRNRLADLLVDGAMWLSEKLYGMTQQELDFINETLDKAEREASQSQPKQPVPVPRERIGQRTDGDCAVTALVNGRIVKVRIPRGTTWVDGGSC